METYGVYSKDLKGCYVSGLDIIDAKRYLGGDDRVLCLEKDIVTSFNIEFSFHKWRGFMFVLRSSYFVPRLSYFVFGFVTVSWHRLWSKKAYKVMPN